MTTLSQTTWLRFLIWFCIGKIKKNIVQIFKKNFKIGFILYVLYGANNSKENKNKENNWLTPFICKNNKIRNEPNDLVNLEHANMEITKF